MSKHCTRAEFQAMLNEKPALESTRKPQEKRSKFSGTRTPQKPKSFSQGDLKALVQRKVRSSVGKKLTENTHPFHNTPFGEAFKEALK